MASDTRSSLGNSFSILSGERFAEPFRRRVE
jgi:hypothetical protein